MNKTKVAELAAANGNTKAIGTSGLEVYYGQIEKADNSKLFWPNCYDLFNKFLRRDPQVAQWLSVAGPMASKVDWYWELPTDKPTDTEQDFLEFLHTIWDDLPGGQRQLIDTYIHYILMGWEWFENVPMVRNGLRMAGTDRASVYDDGLKAFSGIEWRDHSSFSKWDIDDRTGKVGGFIQRTGNNTEVTIPLNRSTHVTLGDPTSPEGLSPFEALWRLESFMYNLEIILGIGSEHAAGHVKFQSTEKLTATDQTNIKESARAIMSAIEGNYLALPGHITADIIDVAFSAGPGILEAIKHYGHLKAQVLNMQWMSLSLDGTGSNASMFTSANMWLTGFNSGMAGGARQIGLQLATQLRAYNHGAFGSVKRLPVLKAMPVDTNIALPELAQFMSMMEPILDISPADKAAVRRKSGFLPEVEITEISEDEDTEGAGEFGEGGLVTQDRVLNGAQIASALKIVAQFNEGQIPREIAIFMISTFFNLPREVASAMVPATPQGGQVDNEPDETTETELQTNIEHLAKRLASGDLTFEQWQYLVKDEIAEFARPVAIGRNQPTVTEAEDLLDLDDEDDIKRMIRRIERIDPFIASLLEAEEADEE